MSITAGRESIITRLAPFLAAGVAVKGLPDETNVVGEQRGLTGNGHLLVFWDNDDPAPPNRSDKSTQDVTRNWKIHGELRNLKGQSGLETVVQTLYQLTIGWAPEAHGKLIATSMDFVERSRNYWVVEYQLACGVLVMGQAEAEPGDVGANLQQVFFDVPTLSDRWGENVGQGDLPTP